MFSKNLIKRASIIAKQIFSLNDHTKHTVQNGLELMSAKSHMVRHIQLN